MSIASSTYVRMSLSRKIGMNDALRYEYFSFYVPLMWGRIFIDSTRGQYVSDSLRSSIKMEKWLDSCRNNMGFFRKQHKKSLLTDIIESFIVICFEWMWIWTINICCFLRFCAKQKHKLYYWHETVGVIFLLNENPEQVLYVA